MSNDESSAGPTTGKRARSVTPFDEDDEPGPQPAAAGGGMDIEDDDAEDVGPMPMPDAAPRKRRKVLKHEQLFLDHLPSADRYSKSFMHRDVLNFSVVTKTNFLITTSIDGHLKLWKKQDQGIEFVKHYRAHTAPIIGVAASADGQLFATIAEDGSAKVFDVVNFDMITMLKLDYTPLACCWVHRRGEALSQLAISDANSSTIYIYDGRGDGKPLETITKVHHAPVHLIAYTDIYDTVISADISGMLEYWQPREPFEPPTTKKLGGKTKMWELKSTTDLYEFKKTKSTPSTLTFSPNATHFATISFPTLTIRIFNFSTGKMTRKYDESMRAVQEMQQAGTLFGSHRLNPSSSNPDGNDGDGNNDGENAKEKEKEKTDPHSSKWTMDDMEFGRRLAIERELEKEASADMNLAGSGGGGRIGRTMNAVWDESGNFLVYGTMVGIKVINVLNNKVVRLLGKDETGRWLNLSLYQGAPAKKGMATLAMAASANPILQSKEVRDPTLFCTAYKRPRFYMFTRSEPEESKSDRDVFNEKPSRDEQQLALSSKTTSGPGGGLSPLAHSATIHTTLGDIHIKLFPQHAPKSVENFVGLARRGYYDNVIFHRVIKKFMIQTGDPLGDGTGGTSIWDREFEDEFSEHVKHDRPYTLSMANAGPNTNGSQFFITTTVTPWLDNKHTVFGRAVSGLEVIHNIENARANKVDKPFEDIHIVNVDVE